MALTNMAQVPFTGMVRQEAGAMEMHQQTLGSEASAAIEAREVAQIKARYAMALQRPRNIEQVRVRLLDACRRPTFAATAMYARPVGREKNRVTGKWEEKIATGPSIRFVEAAVQFMGNLLIEPQITYDSPSQRKLRVMATDLESNATWCDEIVVAKQVERRQVKEGQDVIGERLNSAGDKVYIVAAGDDELQTKVAAVVAKRARKLCERLIPADIVEECMEQVLATQAEADAKNPTAAKRKLIDAFHAIGVSPDDLALYLGKDLERLTPADFQTLRGVYASVKDGDATWEDVLIAKNPSGSVEAAEAVAGKKLEKMRTQAAPAPTAPTVGPSVPSSRKPELITSGEADKLRDLAEATCGPGRLAEILASHGLRSVAEVTRELWVPIYRAVEEIPTGPREDMGEPAPELTPEQEPPETLVASTLPRQPNFRGFKK